MQTKLVREKNAMKDALRVLRYGGILIYPTETSYGIGCDATNAKAVNKVFKIKKRSAKAMLIIVSDVKMANRYAKLNNVAKILIEKFMPGPLSLVCAKKKPLVNFASRNSHDKELVKSVSRISHNKKTIGFRISSHKFAKNLVKTFGKPIVSTSANVSGNPALYNVGDGIKYFYGKVDLIVDGGNLKNKKTSTIFDCVSRKLLRKGSVSEEDIFRALRK